MCFNNNHDHKCVRIFSNMSRSPLQSDGQWFPTAEHRYQALKCAHYGRYDLMRRIMATPNPYAAKRIARRLPAAARRNWRETEATTVMMKVLGEKWIQCTLFRNRLLEYRHDHLLEETADNYWGIGCTEAEAAPRDLTDLPGENWLGKMLMFLVRYKLGQRIPALYNVHDYDESE